MTTKEESNKKQYFSWVDTVRAICMIFVYYVHSQDYTGIHFDIDHGIISGIYVNAFFVISGYLLFRKQLSIPIIEEDRFSFIHNSFKKGITNIIFRIAIPTIVFSALLFVPKQIIAGEPLTISAFLLQTIGGGTYWFTSSLFVAQFLIFLLLIGRKKSIWFYSVVCLVVVVFAMMLCSKYEVLNQSRQPWSYMSGLLSMGLLAAGGVYAKYEDKLFFLFNYPIKLLLLIFLVCTPVYFAPQKFFDFSISMHTVNIQGYLWCVPLSFVLFAICKTLPSIKALSFWGKNSLCLYLLSGVTPRVGNLLLKQFHLNSEILLFILTLITAMLMSSVAIVLINKYFPYFFDLRKIHIKK